MSAKSYTDEFYNENKITMSLKFKSIELGISSFSVINIQNLLTFIDGEKENFTVYGFLWNWCFQNTCGYNRKVR